MKIVICGSMSSAKKMVEARDVLAGNNHDVVLPMHAEDFARNVIAEETAEESTKNKIENDLIRDYYEKIKNSDAVLIVNVDKRGVKNYVGGNAFLEMGFAHVLHKKIYLLNDIPEMIYTDEIRAMQPVVLKGDLEKI